MVGSAPPPPPPPAAGSGTGNSAGNGHREPEPVLPAIFAERMDDYDGGAGDGGDGGDGGDRFDDEDRPARRPPWLVVALVVVVAMVLSVGAYFAYNYLNRGPETQAAGATNETAQARSSASPSETSSPSATRKTATPSPSASPSATSSSAKPKASPSSSRSRSSASPSPSGSATADSRFEDEGWDTNALNGAYCQYDGEFVTMADTEQFQGIICLRDGSYVYRGLDKSNGLTLTTEAEKTDDGYAGILGSTRYEITPDGFNIYTGDELVASDELNVYLTPDLNPFRPGELGLSKPITYPRCDGTGVVVLSSSIGIEPAKEEIQAQLDRYPDAEYVRTDLACDGFNRPSDSASGGDVIYGVYLPVGTDQDEVCDVAREEGGYGVWLSNGISSEEGRVECD